MRRKEWWQVVVAGLLAVAVAGGCQRSPAVGESSNVPGLATPTLAVAGTATAATPPAAPTAAPERDDLTAEPRDDPTPLPAQTSSPATATPATETYTIQPGDTLLGLALARGVGLDELQALNPDVRAEALQIGQQIVVPASSQADLIVPDAETTGSLVAGEPQLVADEQGVWVLGRVLNVGDVALAPAELTVTVRAASGDELTTATLWTAGRRIDPDSFAPYAIYLPGLNGAGATASVTVQAPGLAGAPAWPDLSVDELVVATEEGATVVGGRLVNAGDMSITDLLLTITFYDSSGRYTGYRQLTLSDQLAAGDSRPIRLAALPVFSNVDSVEIQIDARAAE